MRLAGASLFVLALAGCASAQPVTPAPITAPLATATPLPAPPPPSAPAGMQWLYGSGEGAAASLQTYRAFADHVGAAVRKRPADSVVLANPADLSALRFVPCGAKPLAVVLDVDETALQNLGYEYALAARGKTSDGALLDRWQAGRQRSARAMPGAVEALADISALGVTVIFNSNRDAPESSVPTAETLELAGLGRAAPGETLLLRGDVDGKGGKDGRRAWVASRYCVVAMAGDQLADFADGFNARALSPLERRALSERFAPLWGNGWFMLSNPVYGPAMRGGIDDIFAPDVRWNGEK